MSDLQSDHGDISPDDIILEDECECSLCTGEDYFDEEDYFEEDPDDL